jgi:hypothetical protein
MRANPLEGFRIGPFLAAEKDRGTQGPLPRDQRSTLYLKCWGSDYPYLQGLEPRKRWLPAKVDPGQGL